MSERHSEAINVLYVDADSAFAEATAAGLEAADDRFEVDTATGAAAALDRLREGGVDCVLSGHGAAGPDGFGFLRAVRDERSRLPFVLFADGGREMAAEAVSKGATEYVERGSDADTHAVLANRVENAVECERARDAATETERQFAQLTENAEDALFIYDGDWSEMLFVNSAYEEIWGGSISDLEAESTSFLELVHPDDRDAVRGAMERVAGGEAVEIEFRVDRPDGGRLTALADCKPITDDAGAVDRIVGYVRDVTEQVDRERRLRSLNETMQRLMAADTREGIGEIGAGAASAVLGLNTNAVYLYDEDRGALVPAAETEHVAELLGEIPTFTGGDSIVWEAYEEGEALVLDDVHEHPERYNPETPLRSELHLPLGEYGILIAGSDTAEAFDRQDLVFGRILAGGLTAALEQVERTEQLRAREAELARQNDRLEQFASAVSHDLRSPLSVARGRLELARTECDSEHLDDVRGAHERMDTLIDDLLTLAREGREIGELEAVDLGAATRECWRTVDTADATLIVEVDRTIEADSSRLQQLIQNLVGNSVEHGSTGDRPGADNSAEQSSAGDRTEFDNSVEDGDGITVTVGALPDGFYVADDGPGIPESDRERVFDVGYTTSEGGTGFGLSIAKQVADAHGWEIRATDGADGGARFEITGVEPVNGEE